MPGRLSSSLLRTTPVAGMTALLPSIPVARRPECDAV
jgi:hypothetical protein